VNPIIHWLLSNEFWLATQGLVQNSTIVFWALAIVGYYKLTCKARPFCFRHAEHPVEGTAVKVCTHHHTLHDHQAVFAKYSRLDPSDDKLVHGQSHGDADASNVGSV
jgi:hypothetical protein